VHGTPRKEAEETPERSYDSSAGGAWRIDDNRSEAEAILFGPPKPRTYEAMGKGFWNEHSKPRWFTFPMLLGIWGIPAAYYFPTFDEDPVDEGYEDGHLLSLGVGILTPMGEAKVVGEAGLRALIASDLKLSGKGLVALEGSIFEQSGVRVLAVKNIEGDLGHEAIGALGRIVQGARADGISTLQINANLANERLLNILQMQTTRLGGTFTSTGGGEVMTFTFGKF
jgi:hypothetical protein